MDGCLASTIVAIGGRSTLAQGFKRFLALHRTDAGGSALVETDEAGHPALTVVGGYKSRRDAAGTA